MHYMYIILTVSTYHCICVYIYIYTETTGKATRHNVRVGELRDWISFEQHYINMHHTLIKQYHLEGQYDYTAELQRYKDIYRPLLLPMMIDSVSYLYQQLKLGKKLLAEGANAALLDID